MAKGYGSVREALLVNAKFVLSQLEAMNAGLPVSRNVPNYRRSPFAQAMEAEVSLGVEALKGQVRINAGGAFCLYILEAACCVHPQLPVLFVASHGGGGEQGR